jgi:hypothetical protein
MNRQLTSCCFVALAVCLLCLSSGAQAQAPAINGLSDTTYSGGPNPITIYGTNFGSSQGSSTITVNGVVVSAAYGAWSNTSIPIFPPTSGNVVITVNGVQSNSAYVTVTSTPNLTGVVPSSGAVGSTVVLTANSLSGCAGSITIWLNGIQATIVSSDDGSITVVVPSVATGTQHFSGYCGWANFTNQTFTVTTSQTLTDPGIQSGRNLTPQASPPAVSGVSASSSDLFFIDGLQRFFQEVFTASAGLGPRFNSDSCGSCHFQPAFGGSSPCPANATNCAGTPINPQSGMISEALASSSNTLPSFITSNGPVVEARFPYLLDSNGQPDTALPSGLVEDIFTVRSTACSLSQPNFAAAISTNDIAFRIPTPIFGDGLIENLDDSTLLANRNANLNNSFGIAGTFNRSIDDGTISRFGWKAQVKSLHQFAGQAFNGEMGITNSLFPNERPNPEEELNVGGTGLASSCLNLAGTGYPEMVPIFFGAEQGGLPTPEPEPDGPAESAMWMRFLAPPAVGVVVLNGNSVPQATINAGATQFSSIGCQTCHNSSVGSTQASNFNPGLGNVAPQPYSDFEIHHMGTNLADNISQGSAGGDQFRTAPLWGLGQRYFLMHDGRDTDLLGAIEDHAGNGSEATTSVTNFNNLSSTAQQELLDFLRSL